MPSTETNKSVTLYAVVELRNATEDHLAALTHGLQRRGFDILPDELQHRKELRASDLYVTGPAECFEKLTGVELDLTTKTIKQSFRGDQIESEIAVGISPQLITELKSVDNISQHIASVYFEPRLEPSGN